MKNYYFVFPVMLLLVGCQVPSNRISDLDDLFTEKVYSVKEFQEKCSFPKEFEFKGFVIKKEIYVPPCGHCPLGAECNMCKGESRYLIINDGDKESKVYVGEHIWNSVEQNKEYIFTFGMSELYPNFLKGGYAYIKSVNTLDDSRDEVFSNFEDMKDYLKELEKVCEIGAPTRIKGFVLDKTFCVRPPSNVPFHCPFEQIVSISDGDSYAYSNMDLDWGSFDKEVRERLLKGRQYIFTLRNGRFVSAELV